MRRTSYIITAALAVTLAACSAETETKAPEQPFSTAVAAYADGNYGTALPLIEPHAKSGNVTAQMMLAELYLTGKAGIVDETEGVNWLGKAAEQGDVKALSMMGTRYLNGQGVETDEDKAVEYLLAAAKDGNARANIQMGFLYEYGKAVEQDYDAAGRFYYRAALMGDEEGVSRLAKLSETDAVGPSAYLGLLYRDGKIVEQNSSKAFALVLKDAEAGHPYSQHVISEAYGVGQGTERDIETAYMWANLAAAQSFPEAAKRRDVWAQIMTPEQIETAQTMSREWQANFDATSD
ncbi:tetratricopeptide repeat protein [Litorimonas sp. WD9-15]|uniref:tetratricopeptide repeat protein n=1 Tax=Litorimonas sp. WD9-15 TaxID=3418716 RepID=UPI003D081A88